MISRQEKLSAPDEEQESPPARRIPQGDLGRSRSKLSNVALDGGPDVAPGLLDEKVSHSAGHERRPGAHAKQGPGVAPRTCRAVFDPELSRASRGNG